MKIPFKIMAFTLFFLGVGYLAWKLVSNPLPRSITLEPAETSTVSSSVVSSAFQSVTVGSITITAEDFQWELDTQAQSLGLSDSEELTLINKPGVPSTTEKAPPIKIAETTELQEQIMTTVLERKIIYQYLSNPALAFDLSNPALFTKCLETLKEAVANSNDLFSSDKSKERLKAKLCEQSVIDQYTEAKLWPAIKVDPSEIALYYRLHEKDFKRPARLAFRQIVFATEAKAREIQHEVKKSNFAQLAEQYSITPEASKGGLVGPFPREQLPTLFDGACELELNQISGIIKSEYGFHIIMPIERTSAQTLSLSAATPIIRDQIIRTKKRALYRNFLHKAMNSVSVSSTTSGVF